MLLTLQQTVFLEYTQDSTLYRYLWCVWLNTAAGVHQSCYSITLSSFIDTNNTQHSIRRETNFRDNILKAQFWKQG